MRSFTTLAVLIVLSAMGMNAAAGTACSRVPASFEKVAGVRTEPLREAFHWTGYVDRGSAIEVRGINGDVRAEPSSSGRVEVTATKRDSGDAASAVDIQIVQHRGGVTISTVLPGKARTGSAPIDFVLRVPPGVRFIGRTVNGQVEARSLSSDVEAYTVDGSIGVSTAGHAVAETVNGSIKASLGATRWARPLEFKTVNGAITVELPANANADVHGHTTNGEICSDFPLPVQGEVGPKGIAGTLGKGGPQLMLSTVNGSVQLRRGRRL